MSKNKPASKGQLRQHVGQSLGGYTKTKTSKGGYTMKKNGK